MFCPLLANLLNGFKPEWVHNTERLLIEANFNDVISETGSFGVLIGWSTVIKQIISAKFYEL